MYKTEVEVLKAKIVETEKQCDYFRQALEDTILKRAESDQALAERDAQILTLKKINAMLEKELKHLLQSQSWKLTKPLRIVRRILDTGRFDLDDGYVSTISNESQHGVAGEPFLEDQILFGIDSTPLLNGMPLLGDKLVKLICFYQTQPVEKDLFNLKDMDRQIGLAKSYGIYGFCFYADVLKDTPEQVRSYLDDSSFDLPFCLCWRKDKQDSKVTYNSQEKRAEECIGFINEFLGYLKDHRYIRIDNKPLLLFQSSKWSLAPQLVAEKWRHWCHENGIGDIYLVYVRTSTTEEDLAKNNFDAGIDLSYETDLTTAISRNAQIGKVNASKKAVELSDIGRNYVVYHGISLSQNQSSDPDEGSHSLRFFKCLDEIIDFSVENIDCPQKRLTFMDSWSDLVAQTYLENKHFSFASLEAIRMALACNAARYEPQVQEFEEPIAVVIHAFYEDIVDEVLGYIASVDTVALVLYVTTPISLLDSVRRKLQKQKHKFYVLPVSNRGRDVLPFLKILPEVVKGKHELLIKIHTKKSMHRDDGDLWRRDVFDKLLMESALKVNIDYLKHNHHIGILGPTEHIVPLDRYMGKNKARVVSLSARMGVDCDVVETLNFVAGTMFMARTRALIPLMNLALSETDFEAEVKQNDGTLAHALERVFPVSAMAVGLSTTCVGNIITENYKFVSRVELD